MLLHLNYLLRLGFRGLGPVMLGKAIQLRGIRRSGRNTLDRSGTADPPQSESWDVSGLAERRCSIYTGFTGESKGKCSIAYLLPIVRAKPKNRQLGWACEGGQR